MTTRPHIDQLDSDVIHDLGLIDDDRTDDEHEAEHVEAVTPS